MAIDFPTLLLILFSGLVVHVIGRNIRHRRYSSKLPPGPFQAPIIGNLLQLGQKPHRSLTKLSETYGPIMNLKLGSIQAIVVSSPQLAKEILQKHDQACASRAVPCAARVLDHHQASIGWLPASSTKWRKFRKACKEQLFSAHRLHASEGLRKEKLKQLCDYLQKCSMDGQVVDVGEVSFVTSLNLIWATLFSVDFACYGSSSTKTQECKELVQGMLKILGTPNLADYFPVLRFIDPQGIERQSEVYHGRLLELIDEVIGERLQSRGGKCYSRQQDFLESLLDLDEGNEQSHFSLNDIKHFFLELIVAGADTTADSVQWAMAELLRNPKKMSKARDELMTVIGDDKPIKESDISRLPYLHAVIKETFRLHPAAPFLIPRKAGVDIELNEKYMIPKDAHILVNVWAIGRDSRIWVNPDSFEPERFLDKKIDYRGQDFELITFGSGRKMCPGLPLAHVMVHLTLATLIRNFDWKLETGIQPEDLDMNEKFGLALHKAVPLKAFPIKQ